MKEYLTDAIILGNTRLRENDREGDFYTKEFGRIRAKAIGGQKILSKFSLHLDTLNRVRLRVVKKKGLTVTDVVTEDRFHGLRGNSRTFGLALDLVFLLRCMVGENVPDRELWYALLRSFEHHTIRFRTFLKLLGYDSLYAHCEICVRGKAEYFLPRDHMFLCLRCRGNFKENEVVCI